MKKTYLLAFALAFVMSMGAPLYAADLPAPVDKIVTGTVDVIKSPLALYEHPVDRMEEGDHKMMGFFKGVLEAPFHVVKRAGDGLVHIATFPIK